MQVGLIGKKNNKGLGTLSREYMKHLPINKFCEIGQVPDDFFDDLDVCFILEWHSKPILDKARNKGCKTILKVNYEFLPENHGGADLYLCSSSLNYDAVKGEKMLLPDPSEERPFKERKTAKVFVHNAGTLGLNGANGTQELIKAMDFIYEDIKLIIRSQVPLKCNNPKIDLRIGDVPHETLYDEGDVFVMPQKFRATSLPIQEAMMSGMPVLSSDIQPFNEFVNFTFPVSDFEPLLMTREVNSAVLDPYHIAHAIKMLYNKDITNESRKARAYAESISWDNLKDKYKELCNI